MIQSGLVTALTLLLLQQVDPSVLKPIVDDLAAIVDRLKIVLAPPDQPPVPPSVVIRVPAGGDLQAAIDQAQPGQTILLAPATFTGNFVMRKKAGEGVITIRTDGLDDTQLPPGVRIHGPTLAPKLAKLACGDCSRPILDAENGARGYTWIGIEIGPNLTLPDRALVRFGIFATSKADLPHDLTFDRVYLHGSDEKGGHVGIGGGAVNLTVINSDLRNFWERGRDSQALGFTNGGGPYRFENNYLEGSGENILFGGDDPRIVDPIDGVPSDITIRRNHLYKPVAWKTLTGSVKNLLELKNARRVVIEGNVLENVWTDAQAGNGVYFKPTNQGGNCPFCIVEDVTFQYNVLKNVQNYAIVVTGFDWLQPTSKASGRYVIRHNLIEGGRGMLFDNQVDTVTIDHNLFLGVNHTLFAMGPPPNAKVTITHNVARSGLYGIKGSGQASGTATLTWCCPDAVVQRNLFEQAVNLRYPAGNYLLGANQLADRLSPLFDVRLDAAWTASDDLPLGPELARLRELVQGVSADPFAEVTP